MIMSTAVYHIQTWIKYIFKIYKNSIQTLKYVLKIIFLNIILVLCSSLGTLKAEVNENQIEYFYHCLIILQLNL